MGYVQVPGRLTYAFGVPRHSFLGAGELFGCADAKLNSAGIHVAGTNSCVYFLCIFFLISGCSNPERAKY